MGAPTLPLRMRHLAVDHRGFVVPWFVQWFDDAGRPVDYGKGRPDFRVVDRTKFSNAIGRRRCWICGEQLGVRLAFLIGPMCAVNRTTAEPPAHRECAEYSAQTCPFLSRPRMRRNTVNLPEHRTIPGKSIDHNPGAICLWMTRTFERVRVTHGTPGSLITIGPPDEVTWWAEGRAATRAEVQGAIDKGLPQLRAIAAQQGLDSLRELDRFVVRAMPLLPPAIADQVAADG